MAKKTPPCVVVVNAVRPDFGGDGKRRTVTPAMGAPYQMVLPPCEPVLLVGEDEITAFRRDLEAPSIKWLTLAPDQAQRILGDLCEKAAADEITRLRQRVAGLEAKLEALAEPVGA